MHWNRLLLVVAVKWSVYKMKASVTSPIVCNGAVHIHTLRVCLSAVAVRTSFAEGLCTVPTKGGSTKRLSASSPSCHDG